jgi:hypothetical protein
MTKESEMAAAMNQNKPKRSFRYGFGYPDGAETLQLFIADSSISIIPGTVPYPLLETM